MSQKYKLKPTYRISKIELFNSKIENINHAKNDLNNAIKDFLNNIIKLSLDRYYPFKRLDSQLFLYFCDTNNHCIH